MMQEEKWNKYHLKSQGLTLLELMISLLILSIVAVIAITGLHSVLLTRERTSIVAQQLKQLQMAHFQMQRDFSQMVDQPFINQLATAIRFDANGFTNPLSVESRSTLQRISYEFQGNQLIRSAWQTIEQGPLSQPGSQVLIEGVDRFGIEAIYLNEGIFPALISVNFNLENRGHVQWFFNIAGGSYG